MFPTRSDIVCSVRDATAIDGLTARPARSGDSDSENGGEQSCVERPRTAWLLARPRVGRRMDELMAEDHRGVIHAWSGQAALRVLPEELRSGERAIAVIAGAVTNHARGGGGLVVAGHRGNGLGMTPCPTQQRGAWRRCQCQRNRKDNGSKHVMLGSIRGKKSANETPRAGLTNRRLPTASTRCWAGPGEFPHPRADNPAPRRDSLVAHGDMMGIDVHVYSLPHRLF